MARHPQPVVVTELEVAEAPGGNLADRRARDPVRDDASHDAGVEAARVGVSERELGDLPDDIDDVGQRLRIGAEERVVGPGGGTLEMQLAFGLYGAEVANRRHAEPVPSASASQPRSVPAIDSR